MTTYFQDSFTGTGNLVDHTPDTGFAGGTWQFSGGITLSGGVAAYPTGPDFDLSGISEYGDANTDYAHPTSYVVDFTFRTGSDVSSKAEGHYGMLLRVHTGGLLTDGIDVDVRLDAAPGGGWSIRLGATSQAVTVTGSTDYVGKLTIGAATQQLELLGYTLNRTDTPTDGTIGLNYVYLELGYTHGISELEVLDPPAPPETISITATAPTPTVAMKTGMRVAIAAPMPVVNAVISGRNNAINITAPMPLVEMRMGNKIAISAPVPTVQMSGTTTGTIRISATAPVPQVGMVMTATGAISIQAKAPMATVEMRGGANVVVVAPMAQVAMEMTTGSVISITATAPMAEVDMRMSKGETISVEIDVPMPVAGPWGRIVAVAPMAQVTMVMRTVVSVTYEAYAVNLKPGANMPNQVTRYTNFPFNQIVRYQGKYYGVASDGLYLLGGDTDYHAVTPAGPPWAFKTAVTDFGSSRTKVTRETFLGARLGPTVSASVSIGEAADVTYAAQILRGANAQNHRVKYGKGLEARYWSFGFSDTAGGEVDIDTLEFDARETGRKM